MCFGMGVGFADLSGQGMANFENKTGDFGLGEGTGRVRNQKLGKCKNAFYYYYLFILFYLHLFLFVGDLQGGNPGKLVRGAAGTWGRSAPLGSAKPGPGEILGWIFSCREG